MARRPDPLRIYAARRAGLFERLTHEARIGEASAEQWLVAWESQARERHLDGRKPEWWDPAWEWIAEQRRGSSRCLDAPVLPLLTPHILTRPH